MVTSISKSDCRVVALNTSAAGSKPLRTEAELSPAQAKPPLMAGLDELSQLAPT